MRSLHVALLALVAIGCKKDPEKEIPNPDEGRRAREPAKPAQQSITAASLASSYLECLKLSRSKLEDFKKKCIAPSYRGHEVDGGEIGSPDALVANLAALKTAFSDLEDTAQLVLVSGSDLLAIDRVTGTHDGDLKQSGVDVTKTGKKIGVLVFRHVKLDEQGRADERFEYADPLTIDAQLRGIDKALGARRPAQVPAWPGAPIVVTAQGSATEKANRAMWTKYATAFNAHKPDDMIAYWADDAIESDQADGADHHGKAKVLESITWFLNEYPDVTSEFSNVFAIGDYVVALGKCTGKNKAGKTLDNQFAEVAKIEGGKIARMWRFRNSHASAIQLGQIK